MGRKKIKIARINDDRNRSVTYLKRKAGLMKKAHELAVLTGSEVAVIVFGQNGKLTEFCSGDMDRVLLRYTEHTGPVERKGPEHYSNDDDEGSDEEGGDAEDAEGVEGTGGARGISGVGDSTDPYSPTANGGSVLAHSEESKSNKRKAPNGHRMKDVNNSVSSTHSSKRGSPPSAAPIIKVEGDTDNVAIDGSVQKGVLKAAIIQRSISKPGSHDGSGGSTSSRPHTGTHSAKSMSGPEMSIFGDSGSLQMSSMPHRPYTAGGMADMHPSLSPGMLAQQYQRQQATSPRFAFSNDQSNTNPSINPFLQAQASWVGENDSPQLNRANSAQPLTPNDVSYGDLARGGSSRPHSPYKVNHDGSVSPNPPQHSFNPAQNYASLQLPQQGSGSSSLLPLAHPILRQHPQYEAYTNQLRVQQQQLNASRSGSHPISSAHTAPSSPNHLMIEDHSTFSNGLGVTTSDPTLIRRSASFGYMEGNPDRRDFQQTFNQSQYQFVSTFDTSGVGKRATSQQPTTQYSQNVKDYGTVGNDGTNAMPPPSYGHLDAQNTTEPSISNAAFNDLMGSILSDMESTANSGGSTNAGGSLSSADERTKEQEDVIRSMESEGSLTTLVNSESFDAIMANGSEDVAMTSTSGNKKKASASSTSALVKSRKG